MGKLKIIIKQYAKGFIHKYYLPLIYKRALRKNIDEKLCILADSNTDTIPESMELVRDELKKRGYVVKEMYQDFSHSSLSAVISYMREFMKAYANCRGVFICNYFVPCTSCNKRAETTVVQLWHSCGGLKKFGYDSPEDIDLHYKGNVTKNFDLITVSSDECIKVFDSAFRLKEPIVKALGVSRTDVFFNDKFNEECKKNFYEKYPQYNGKKILLYAPTFRGNASDAYCVGENDIVALREKLGDEWAVIIKMHPRLDSRLTNCDISTNRLFAVADVLVTDYSSLIFEYALFKKPVVLFVPDLEQYSRGFYLDYKKDMAGVVCTDPSELAEKVLTASQTFDEQSYEAFTEKYMSACDGHSTQRIVDYALGKNDRLNGDGNNKGQMV